MYLNQYVSTNFSKNIQKTHFLHTLIHTFYTKKVSHFHMTKKAHFIRQMSRTFSHFLHTTFSTFHAKQMRLT
jgi:hypothetical protein